MKHSTQKRISLFAAMALGSLLNAQSYCVPTTAVPYDNNMPGITNFTLNTINRNSAACEGCPSSNNYILTGLSTNLVAGSTYTVSITHTVDASICPDMNLRVWIDYNHNYILDDAGETAISTNNHLPGTYTATFTVPTTATPGATRLRATAKMTSNGGHTLPTPCDSPPDPIGYHGEIEDYTVNISAATGITEADASIASLDAFPNPGNGFVTLTYSLKSDNAVTIGLFDITGKEVLAIENKTQKTAGNYLSGFNTGTINKGLYFIKMTAGNAVMTRKFLIVE